MWVLTLLLLFLLAAGARAQTASPTAGPASSSPVLLYWESTPYTASELNSYNTRSAMNGICSSDPQYSENKCAYGFAVIGGISGESSIANCVLPGTSTPISCTDQVRLLDFIHWDLHLQARDNGDSGLVVCCAPALR